MFGLIRKRRRRRKINIAEAQHDALQVQAEMDLASLSERGENAVRALEARHRRNHWRESIEQMIQGGTPT